jgi:hyperosmotically inducible protein
VVTNGETVTRARACSGLEDVDHRARRLSMGSVGLGLLLGVSVGLLACGHTLPDDAMARAAHSQEALASKLEDRAMKAEMLANLMEDRAIAGADVTPYVYMGHAFLVGSVRTPAQRDAAIADAGKVQGVRSVEAYLSGAARGRTASDRALRTELEGRLSLDPALTGRVHLQMVDGHAVLLGVVPSREAVQSAGRSRRAPTGSPG